MAGRPLAQTGSATYNNALIGPSLFYEIDLFGRVRNALAASRADARASASDLAGVRLGLQAQLASAYFDMRGHDARIVLRQETVDADTGAFQSNDTRRSGRIASGIDVSRSQSQLSSARVEPDSVHADRARDEHAVAILVGMTPSTFVIAVEDRQIAPPAIPTGLPSTLLERRPDILAAERRVVAANARIGVARAAPYPNITLGASRGFEAGACNLLSAANGSWALGPLSCAQSLFDGGARRADVGLWRAQFDEAAADYRQTVLTTFRAVADELAASRYLIDQERPAGRRHRRRAHPRSRPDAVPRRCGRLSRAHDRANRSTRCRTRLAPHPHAATFHRDRYGAGTWRRVSTRPSDERARPR